MTRIYLDWAATTIPSEEALEIFSSTARNYYGNPSSIHAEGEQAKGLLDEYRSTIASALNTRPEFIYFTSGGTESNNIVINNFLAKPSKVQILSSAVEHPSVYHPVNNLAKSGHSIDFIRINSSNSEIIDSFLSRITEKTSLVTIMLVNNVTGAWYSLSPLIEAIRERSKQFGRKIHIHTDAVQAFGKLPIDLSSLDVDSLSASSHKIYAPRGCGILYSRNKLNPLYSGGGQESEIRPGTENLPGIAALSYAFSRAHDHLDENITRTATICRRFTEISDGIPGSRIISPREDCSGESSSFTMYNPYILNISFPPVPSEVLVRVFRDKGISVSAGSACSSKKKGKHRVLNGMGIDEKIAASTVRFSFSPFISGDLIDSAVEIIRKESGSLMSHL